MMRLDEESRDGIYYGLQKVMYIDIKWKKTQYDFIEWAKINANFIFDTIEEYRRAWIVSSLDVRGTQRVTSNWKEI